MKPKALVVGGTGGIGSAIVSYFTKLKFDVTSTSTSDFDLKHESQVIDWLSNYNSIPEILVCNAGINNPNLIYDQNQTELREILEVNFFSHSYILKHFAKKMSEKSYGRIVVISSAYAHRFREGRSAYSASKSALEAYSKTLALECAKSNVLINCVAPGFLKTPLTLKNNDEQKISEIRSQIPIGRLGEVEEIVDLIGYLSSVKNTYITGQTIDIDGGFSLI